MQGVVHELLFELRRHRIRDQKGLWVNSFLRQMAYAMVSVLSMVFIFEFGRERFLAGGLAGGLALVMIYMLIIRLVVVMLVIWVANYVIRRIGYRRSVLLSLVLSAMSFLALSQASVTGQLGWIVVAAAILGLVVCMYWVTYYTLFSDDADEKHLGESFGLLEGVSNLGRVVAPLAGVAIAVRFGFEALFLSGIFFLAVSGIPMLFLGHHLHLDEVSWGELAEWLNEATYVRASVAMGGRFINLLMYEQLWPVYVFLLVGSLKGIGVFLALMMLSSAVFGYLVARVFDRSAKKRYEVVGVAGSVMVWAVRLSVRSFTQVLLVDSLDKFFMATSRMFFYGYLFKRSKGRESFSFVVYWVWSESIWAVAACLVLLGILTLVGTGAFWGGVMFLGAVGLLISLLITDHR